MLPPAFSLGMRPQTLPSVALRQGVEAPKLNGQEASAKIRGLFRQLELLKDNPEATARIHAEIDQTANVFGASKKAMIAFLKNQS